MAELVQKISLKQFEQLPSGAHQMESDGIDSHSREMKLGVGKYMRHIPSGRVYPYELNGAKREDVELFFHTKEGKDIKVNKPPKPKKRGPFAQRDEGIGSFDRPGANIEEITS